MSEKSNDKSPTSAESRRDFIKKSSSLLVAGGVAGSMVGGQLPLARAANVAGVEEIKIGLVGCGGRGTGAATQALNTTSGPLRLVAMGDVFEDRLQASYRSIKGKHGDKVDVPKERQFVGFDAYKDVLNSDIDLIILATPPGFRPLHFEAAVNAGKHIFFEKPVATDGPGIRRVLAANEIAKQKNLSVRVGLQRHHEPRYIETIEKLQAGAIGDINFMRAYWNNQGVWVRPRNEQQTEMEYQMRNWYYFNWLCGDHIVEQHIHNLDVINWLKGGHPVLAQGTGGREVRKGVDNGQIFDHHMVEFTYADGSKLLSMCRHQPGCWTSVSEHAHGSQGSSDINRYEIFDKDGKLTWKSEAQKVQGHQHEHTDMFADLFNGVIRNEGDYGATSTMTAIFGRMATYSGKQIKWEDAIGSELALADFDSMEDFNTVAPVLPNDNMEYYVPVPGKKTDKIM